MDDLKDKMNALKDKILSEEESEAKRKARESHRRWLERNPELAKARNKVACKKYREKKSRSRKDFPSLPSSTTARSTLAPSYTREYSWFYPHPPPGCVGDGHLPEQKQCLKQFLIGKFGKDNVVPGHKFTYNAREYQLYRQRYLYNNDAKRRERQRRSSLQYYYINKDKVKDYQERKSGERGEYSRTYRKNKRDELKALQAFREVFEELFDIDPLEV